MCTVVPAESFVAMTVLRLWRLCSNYTISGRIHCPTSSCIHSKDVPVTRSPCVGPSSSLRVSGRSYPPFCVDAAPARNQLTVSLSTHQTPKVILITPRQLGTKIQRVATTQWTSRDWHLAPPNLRPLPKHRVTAWCTTCMQGPDEGCRDLHPDASQTNARHARKLESATK
jgi:hypothetical protein